MSNAIYCNPPELIPSGFLSKRVESSAKAFFPMPSRKINMGLVWIISGGR